MFCKCFILDVTTVLSNLKKLNKISLMVDTLCGLPSNFGIGHHPLLARPILVFLDHGI